MTAVGISEAKNKRPELLDRAARREEIFFTRRGKPVAKRAPSAPTYDVAA